ncbi:MAG: hypothetical protein ACYTF9_04850 [Planctomycetota bacterium]|jgi:hypothetical protein
MQRLKALDGRAALERLKGTRRYDVDMIRDFLRQLVLEVRIHQQEHATRLGGMSLEFREELRKYTEKHAATLLPVAVLDESGIQHEDVARANQLMQARMAKMHEQWLDQLESLHRLFHVAFQGVEAAATHGKGLRRVVHAADLIAQDDAERAAAIEAGLDPDAERRAA